MTLMFSFGSNLCIEQMKIRCPEAEVVGRFKLKGWRLVFRGVADCIQEPGAECYGGIWRITQMCERELDIYEGVRGGLYRKEYIPIKRSAHGETDMLIYCMNSTGIAPPSEHYLGVIEQGYRDFFMPKAAREQLERAVAESWDDKAPSHIERNRYRRKGRPRLAAYPESQVQRLPEGRARGLDPDTVGDRIYAQHGLAEPLTNGRRR